MFVKDWMSDDVVTVHVDDTTRDAWHSLLENSIQRVPVIENDQIAGILSRTDLRSKLHPTDFPGHAESGQTARELMTEDVVTCWPDQPLEEAASKLYHNELACLPVVDEDHHVVGMLSEVDLFRAFYTVMGLERTNRREYFQMADFQSSCEKGAELMESFTTCSYLVWPSLDDDEYNCLLRFNTQNRKDENSTDKNETS